VTARNVPHPSQDSDGKVKTKTVLIKTNNNNQQYSVCQCAEQKTKKKEKKLVVKKHNDRLPEKQKCSFKLATHSLLSVIIINN